MFSGLELDISTEQTKPCGSILSSFKKCTHFMNNNSRKMGTLLNASEGVSKEREVCYFFILKM